MQQRNERTYAEINVGNIIRNISAYRSVDPDKKIVAVLKANAYGHGFLLSKKISDFVDAFAVATVDEALILRSYGIMLPVLVLGYVPTSRLISAVKNDVTINVFALSYAMEVNEFLKNNGLFINAHIKINSGMNRLGFSSKADLLTLKKLANIHFTGLFSHYAVNAKNDNNFFDLQTERFIKALSFCIQTDFSFEWVHIAASPNALSVNVGNAIRIGYGMYGYGPNLVPALSWHARVAQTITLEKGESVGYDRTYIADKKRKIAVVCAGYGDGVPRALSNKGKVLYKGGFLPIIGRVCMDLLTVDATDTDLKEGKYVTFIGKSGDKTLTAEDMGFGYEVLCGIKDRVKRIYVN